MIVNLLTPDTKYTHGYGYDILRCLVLCHVADTLLTEILSANMKVSLKTILCNKVIILGGSPASGRICFFVTSFHMTSFHMTSHITNNGALSLSGL